MFGFLRNKTAKQMKIVKSLIGKVDVFIIMS